MRGDRPFPESSGPIGACRNDDVQLVEKREDAVVHELAAECVERAPIEFFIRAAGLVPLDRGRLQSDGNGPLSGCNLRPSV